MDLRPELRPPALDDDLVDRLAADLAVAGDATLPASRRTEALARFNAGAGSDVGLAEAHAAHWNEDDELFVRSLLGRLRARPASGVTRDELVEVVRRAWPSAGRDEAERRTDMAIFDSDVPLARAADLMFHPPEGWDGAIAGYDPTPEQIVDWALASGEGALRG